MFRIVVVGEGREKFGHVFLADTGTSNGDITGQTRPINTVDFKVGGVHEDYYILLSCCHAMSEYILFLAIQTFPNSDRK